MTQKPPVPKSNRGRILKATAGETLQKGDRVQLVFEYPAGNDVPARPVRVLVAYKARVEGHYHGTALNDAIVGMDVGYQEHIIQEQVPEPDLLNQFAPIRFDERGYALMVVRIDHCPFCGRAMMQRSDVFSSYRALTQEAQMERAGIVFIGAAIPGRNKSACEVCTKEGRVMFTCAFCEQPRTADLLHEEYPEPVCTVCYETLPAKEWEEKEDAMRERHRYDYD